MGICLKTGAEAQSILESGEFQQQWRRLYGQCPWATPFQDYRFVNTWYKIYRDRFEPIILTQSASDGSLVGLLTLASSKDSGQLVAAGAHQAEYQVWLATPERGTSFIELALQKLWGMYPDRSITFLYLPPSTPIDWAVKMAADAPYCEIEARTTPLLILNNSKMLAESFRKKSNKSRLNRLKRLGNVEFEEIRTIADLSRAFNEIISYYDLRQGALHHSVPFKDDLLKKGFYLALMDHPDFLHVTILRVGKEPVAAHLGLHDRGKVYLGVFAHSPFLAQHSPGKLHLLMLGEKLVSRNYTALDLTPGDEYWKDRFASCHENVYIMTVYFSYVQFVRRRVQRHIKAAGKSGLRCLGLTTHSTRSCLEKIKSNKISDLPAKLLRNVWSGAEFRLYEFTCKDAERVGRPQLMINRDHIEDLLAYQPTEHWQKKRRGFLATCLTRLEEGCHVYTFVESELLLHYGWLVPQHVKNVFNQVLFTCPERTVGLFDFYTHPKARNRGLYQMSLCQMLHDAAALPEADRIYITVRADDGQAQHAIEQMGGSFIPFPSGS